MDGEVSHAPVTLATGPVSWGVDFAHAPDNPPWERVFDEIAAAGYAVTELGPLGYLPEDADRVRDELEARGLAVAGSFLFEPLHDPAARDGVVDVARRTCKLISELGGRYLVMIDEASDKRAATAGRTSAAPRLETEPRSQLVDMVTRVAAVAAEEFNLRAVLHNHVGTYVEFIDEIEWVLEAVDEELLGLCIDTGHAAYAGIEPAELFERHHERVPYLHFKDVDGPVLAEARRLGHGFWGAIGAGIFCPLGQGIVDFARLAHHLRSHGFRGWGTVEQDREADSGNPLQDVIASREYLERVGIAEKGVVGR